MADRWKQRVDGINRRIQQTNAGLRSLPFIHSLPVGRSEVHRNEMEYRVIDDAKKC